MKRLHLVGIITLLLIALMTVGIGPVIAQDGVEKTNEPKPLGFYESLEKYGVVNPGSPLIRPSQDKESRTSLPTSTYYYGNGETDDETGYFRAGIETYYNEAWYGFRMVINGGEIENGDPDNKLVRLTPHVCLKNSSDYIAVVLQDNGDEDELDLRTMHSYGSPMWQDHTTVSKSADYEYSLYIDGDNDFQIYYRSYPSGSWIPLRCRPSAIMGHK